MSAITFNETQASSPLEPIRTEEPNSGRVWSWVKSGSKMIAHPGQLLVVLALLSLASGAIAQVQNSYTVTSSKAIWNCYHGAYENVEISKYTMELTDATRHVAVWIEQQLQSAKNPRALASHFVSQLLAGSELTVINTAAFSAAALLAAPHLFSIVAVIAAVVMAVLA